MKIYKSIAQWILKRTSLKGQSIGFVPTMGDLHEGHLSLIRKSLNENDFTVVSIFVNPTQFDNKKDFETYQVSLDKDILLLDQVGVDYVLAPNYSELYPDNYCYRINENQLSQKFCGAHREGHFDGVLTVVMKLLNIVGADRAYFGEKDYQQMLLVRDMCQAFFIKTQIIPCPTVREQDGLAMSSRNKRLNLSKDKAPQFYKILKESPTTEEAKTQLEELGFKVDYVDEYESRRLAAAYLDDVRLIDNVEI